MNYINLYAKFINKFLKVKTPVKVVFDCSNGTTGLVLKKLLVSNKKINAIFINALPNGNFPAHSPNPLIKSARAGLIKKVIKTKADLGVIFDADGDRAVFIDNLGRDIDPRYIIYLLAPIFKEPYLVNAAIGRETMRWLLPKKRFIEEKVGRSFIKKTAQKKKIDFSVERSGHYFFKDFGYADSGILAAIFVVNSVSTLKRKKMSLSKWIELLPKFYFTPENNIKVRNSRSYLKSLERLFNKEGYRINKRDGLTVVGNGIWLNARPSNTEPVVRVSLGAKTKKIFDSKIRLLKEL